ncbi:MAG: hypothetical protein LWW84_15270 [Azovibrio sp.]|nr:hypothetical protein [Azovibrio sp.]
MIEQIIPPPARRGQRQALLMEPRIRRRKAGPQVSVAPLLAVPPGMLAGHGRAAVEQDLQGKGQAVQGHGHFQFPGRLVAVVPVAPAAALQEQLPPGRRVPPLQTPGLTVLAHAGLGPEIPFHGGAVLYQFIPVAAGVLLHLVITLERFLDSLRPDREFPQADAPQHRQGLAQALGPGKSPGGPDQGQSRDIGPESR